MVEKEAEWECTMQPHHEYLGNLQPSPGPIGLDDLCGEYIVRYDMLDDYCSSDEVKTLHIEQPSSRSSHGVTASFDYGMVEGTMLLAMSDVALHQLREDVESDSDVESEVESDEDEEYTYCTDDFGFTKRKVKTNPGLVPFSRRLGSESSIPNRVYLQWAGRETGEGEIQLDTENENTGYLDFDASKAASQGEFMYPAFFGRRHIPIAIWKVSAQSSVSPEPWIQFNEKAYRRAADARWS